MATLVHARETVVPPGCADECWWRTDRTWEVDGVCSSITRITRRAPSVLSGAGGCCLRQPHASTGGLLTLLGYRLFTDWLQTVFTPACLPALNARTLQDLSVAKLRAADSVLGDPICDR